MKILFSLLFIVSAYAQSPVDSVKSLATSSLKSAVANSANTLNIEEVCINAYRKRNEKETNFDSQAGKDFFKMIFDLNESELIEKLGGQDGFSQVQSISNGVKKLDKGLDDEEVKKLCIEIGTKAREVKIRVGANEKFMETKTSKDAILSVSDDLYAINDGVVITMYANKSKQTCAEVNLLNGNFAENCSRLPTNVGEDLSPWSNLMERISLFKSEDILKIQGDSSQCKKCIQKIANNDTKVNEGIAKAESAIFVDFNQKKIEGDIHRLVGSLQTIGDYESVRKNSIGGFDPSQNCIDSEKINSMIEKSCANTGVTQNEAKSRLTKSLKSIGIEIEADFKFSQLGEMLKNKTRFANNKVCGDKLSLRDSYQRLSLNEMFPPENSGPPSLAAESFRFLSKYFDDSKTVKRYCENTNDNRIPSDFARDNMSLTMFDEEKPQESFWQLYDIEQELLGKEATAKDKRDFNNLDHFHLVDLAFEKVRRADPLVRILIENKQKLCNLLNQKKDNESFKDLIATSNPERGRELAAYHGEVIEEYSNSCKPKLDRLVQNLCEKTKTLTEIKTKIYPNQIKTIMQDRLKKIHNSGEILTDTEDSEAIGLGLISCDLNSDLSEDTQERGVDLDGKDLYQSGTIDRSEVSDFLRLEMNKKNVNSHKPAVFLNNEDPLFCDGEVIAETAEDIAANGLYGVRIPEKALDDTEVELSRGKNRTYHIFGSSTAQKIKNGSSLNTIMSEIKSRRKGISARNLATTKGVGTVTTKSVIVDPQQNNIENLTQATTQGYVSPRFANEIKEMDQVEKIIKEIKDNSDATKQIGNELLEDSNSEQLKLDELTKKLSDLQAELDAEIKKVKNDKKISDLKNEKQKLEDEIRRTKENIDFLDKKIESVDKESKVVSDRKSSLQPIANSDVSQGQEANYVDFSRRSGIASTPVRAISNQVDMTHNELNMRTQFIKTEIPPVNILTLIKNADSIDDNLVKIDKDGKISGLFKIPGQTLFIDVSELDEESQNELKSKIDIEKLKKDDLSAMAQIKKIKNDAAAAADQESDPSKKESVKESVTLSGLNIMMITSIAKGQERIAKIAGKESLKWK